MKSHLQKLVTVTGILSMLWLGGLVQSSHATTTQPNIIFILTDDMGYGDLGCYGGKFAPTPNIDRLAREGTRFTQFYVASPICSPSRTGFLTGMEPARWQIHSFLQTRAGNRAVGQADYLNPQAPSIARTLKTAGYATGHFGKWHLGGGRDVTNAPPFTTYGFDEHASTWESPDPAPDLTATNWIWSQQDKVKRWERSAYFVDQTLDFLRRHKGTPCYVNLWPDDVHTPWVSADAPEKRSKETNESEGKLAQVLKEYDRQVGRLLAGLQELGLAENTLVIFTSDNGPNPDFNNTRCGGLRGRKASLYEGGIRTPFIARWPGHIPAGRVEDQTVLSAVDLFPIFCKLAGASLPKNVKLNGEDLSPSLFGQAVQRKQPLFWEYGRNRTAYAYPEGHHRSPSIAVRAGAWKLLVNADGSGAELYHMESDSQETKNMIEQKPKVARRLTKAALQWKQTLP